MVAVEHAGARADLRLLHPSRLGLVLLGNLVSAIGTAVHLTVAAWLVFDLTHSSSWVGLLTLAQQVPVVVLALPAGIVADHVDRRRLLVAIHAAVMLLALGLAVLALAASLPAAVIVAVTVLMGCGGAFSAPAWMAYLSEHATPSEAVRVYSLNSLTFHGANAIGPAIAAGLLGVVGAAGVFGLNAASYLAVIAGVLCSAAVVRHRAPFTGVRSATTEMIGFVRSSLPARQLLLSGGSMAFVAFGLPALLPMYASDVLHGGASSYGQLAATIGVGSFVGAALMGVLSPWLQKRTMIVGGASLIAVGVGTFAAAGSTLPAMVGLAMMGCGQLVMLVTSRTVLMLSAPAGLQGRIVSVWMAVVFGCGPLGGIILGLASDRWGVRPTITAVALYCVVAVGGIAIGARPTQARHPA